MRSGQHGEQECKYGIRGVEAPRPPQVETVERVVSFVAWADQR